MRKRFTLLYLYQILLAKWRPVLISVLIALSLAGLLLCFMTPIYRSELIFQVNANLGMGGGDDPYKLLELSPDESNNHIVNTIISLSSSLVYRKAADVFFPDATKEEKDSLGIWLDDQISVWQVDNTTMLRLCADSEDPYLAQGLLKRFFDFVQKDNRANYEAVMDTTARFLEERILILKNEIEEIDAANADFLIESRAVYPSMAYQTNWRGYRQYTQIEEGLEAELQVALFFQDYVKKTLLEGGLLPNFSIKDRLTAAQIRKYNETRMVFDRLKKEASPDKTVLRTMAEEMAQLGRVILSRLEMEIGKTQIELKKVKGRVLKESDGFQNLSDKISDSYINRRLLRVKLSVYVLLHLRLEEVNIKRSIYESNWRLIEPASFSPIPVRPYYTYIILFFLFLGFVIPLGFYVFFDFLDYRIYTKKELEKYPSIRVFESVPLTDGPQTEAFERMRVELFYRWKEARVLLFTSTLPHEGKSYIARNLAISLAKAGRKVILIDADIRKATQSKVLELDYKSGVSTYLAGKTKDWKSLVHPVERGENLVLMPCGAIPPNPSELLLGDKWEELITELREYYEYVIIDSVPAQLVADAMVAVRAADMSFYVLKKGMIDRRFLPELNILLKKSIFPNMHVVLNGFDPLER